MKYKIIEYVRNEHVSHNFNWTRIPAIITPLTAVRYWMLDIDEYGYISLELALSGVMSITLYHVKNFTQAYRRYRFTFSRM